MTQILSKLLKGAWSGATAYIIGNIVTSNGSSYVCIANHTNQVPPNTSYWELLASKGDQGVQGIQGNQGIQGIQGIQGVGNISSDSIFDAKGDLPVGTGADTASKLAVGADGQGLLAQSSAATGLVWADVTNNSLARQAVINGNFDVAQRGVTLALADATKAYLIDRWHDYVGRDGGTLPTLTRTQETLTPGSIANAFNYARLTTNGAGVSLGVNSIHYFRQNIENGTRFLCGLNKKVTVSFLARSSIANKKLGIYATQVYGTSGSTAETINGTTFTLTSSWQKFTYTFTTNTLIGKTFGTANESFDIAFTNMWGSNLAYLVGAGTIAETYVGAGTIDIAQVQLCAGDVALPFMPKSFDDELRTCMRYYEKSYDYATPVGCNSLANGATIQNSGATGATNAKSIIPTAFKVKKRIGVTPVLYDYSGAINKVSYYDAVGNLVSGSIADGIFVGENIFSVYKTLTGISGLLYHWTVDAEL